MGDSVPKHAGPISLTDTHPRTEHLQNATVHRRCSSCLPMQVLWIETHSPETTLRELR
jgi:hypothetical protein